MENELQKYEPIPQKVEVKRVESVPLGLIISAEKKYKSEINYKPNKNSGVLA